MPTHQKIGVNFLLDTNILIYALQKRTGETFHNFLFQLASKGLCFISVINRFELLAGTIQRHKKDNVKFLDGFPLLNVTAIIADRAGDLFRDFRKKGITLDNEDLLLTATALEQGLFIVSTNAKHFPTLKPKEEHHLTFQTRRGVSETKIVHVLAP